MAAAQRVAVVWRYRLELVVIKPAVRRLQQRLSSVAPASSSSVVFKARAAAAVTSCSSSLELAQKVLQISLKVDLHKTKAV